MNVSKTLRLTWSAVLAFLATAALADESADEILPAAGAKGGLIVHVGCGDARLTAALRAHDACLVQGLEPDEDQVERARAYLRSEKLCGSVSVKHWPFDFLPYADNLVNLLIVTGPLSVDREEILRVLCPGGIAAKLDPETQNPKPETLFRKPWPQDIDEWTHWLHGPDNNPVAQDRRVGPPRRVQWIASPKWPKSHDAPPSMTGLVTAQGRMFCIADEGPAGIKHPEHKLERWALLARDAFNGVLLWKKPIEDWGTGAWSPKDYPYGFGPWTVNPRMIHRRLVAVGDRVFVTLGFGAPISMLDAASGDILAIFKETGFASEILVQDGRLFAVVDRAAQQAGTHTPAPQKSALAIDIESGEKLWERRGLVGITDGRRRGFDATIMRLHLTCGGGKVYLLEDEDVIALDADTGKQAWSVPRPEKVSHRNPQDLHPVNDPWDLGGLLYSDGVLYCWQHQYPPDRSSQYRMDLLAISTNDGQILWEKVCGGAGFASFASVYKARGLLWVQSPPEYAEKRTVESYDLLGLNPKTGQIVSEHSIEPIFNRAIHHHRCYRNKATEDFVIFSRNGLEYVDLDSGQIDFNRWVRGICQYGVMPANGLLYVPPQPCACFAPVRLSGYHAFAAEAEDGTPPREPLERLHKGPAFAQPVDTSQAQDEWPVYRHDPQRTGAASCEVSADLNQRWVVRFDEPITAPTVAQKKLFVATGQSHRICAVNTDNGDLLWSFAASNGVDTPPTLANGRVYFGTADGEVCCLRASDGALAWRFDANPAVRHIVSHGNVESTWPVHGSVIVNDGVVYFCAGRSSYLDGGLYFYALDAETGAVIRSAPYRSLDEERAMERNGQPIAIMGAFNDLLVYDAESLFLKNLAIDCSTLDVSANVWKYIPAGRVLPYAGSPFSAVPGFLDDSAFDRVGWILDHHLRAKMIVYNDQAAFAMRWRTPTTFWHQTLFEVGKSEHSVFAQRRKQRKTVTPAANGFALEEDWQVPVPMRVRAMLLAENTLLLAGVPWPDDADDVLAALRGKNGGILWAVDPSNGSVLGKRTLDALPVWDGMAAAYDDLYVTTEDGSLMCFGAK